MELINKRGIFFSMDALIALSIILMVLVIAYPTIQYFKKTPQIHNDVIQVLSTLSIGEINNSYVINLIAQGDISDLNKSILEQIGEFYVTNESLARDLANNILGSLDTGENYGLWYENSLIYSSNNSEFELSDNVYTTRQLITGIKQGENVTGYSARVFLSRSKQTSYTYLGGYVGDGNLTLNTTYLGNISSAELELASGKDFELFINGVSQGNFSKSSSEYIPKTYNLSVNNFNSGTNILTFKGQGLYFTGGYLKIVYDPLVSYNSSSKYYLPGINGTINIYDGVFVSNNFSEMNVYLHYNSSYPFFVNIGNITIFNNSGASTQLITNATLSSLLNYSTLKNKTIPWRIGLVDADYALGKNAYIISIVDLSGGVSSARTSGCGNSGLCAVQKANRLLVDSILSVNGTYVGLVGVHQGSVSSAYSHSLSTNSTALNNTINSWTNNGNLDLCYGIQNATNSLISVGSSGDLKNIVLLGTKFPNSCLGSSGNVYQDTYNLACSSWTNYSIKINTIGIIGNSQSDANLNSLLYNISLCANGTYNNASASSGDIVQLYNQTVQELLNLTYNLQTTIAASNTPTILYPDSYIEVVDSSTDSQFGLNLFLEKNFSNSTYATFSLPSNSTLVKAEVLSYSGPRWTSLIKLNSNWVYNLSSYGNSFTLLGDPFVFRLPSNLVNSSNSIYLTTGFSSLNNTQEGSTSNKIIYQIVKNFTAYSGLSSSAQGCNWIVESYDGSNFSLIVPPTYLGPNACVFSSSSNSYNVNDAYQSATFNLLRNMDIDSDNKVDIKISQQELNVSSTELEGIPFTWTTEVEVRTWD